MKLLATKNVLLRTLSTNVIVSDVFNICKIIYGGDKQKS